MKDIYASKLLSLHSPSFPLHTHTHQCASFKAQSLILLASHNLVVKLRTSWLRNDRKRKTASLLLLSTTSSQAVQQEVQLEKTGKLNGKTEMYKSDMHVGMANSNIENILIFGRSSRLSF